MPATMKSIREHEENLGEFRYIFESENGACVRLSTHRPPFLAGVQHKSIMQSSETWTVYLDLAGTGKANVNLGFIGTTAEIPAKCLEVDWRIMLDNQPCMIAGLSFERKTVVVVYVPCGEILTINSPYAKAVRLVSTDAVTVFRDSIS